MKIVLLSLLVIFHFQGKPLMVSCQRMTLDPKTEYCIQKQDYTQNRSIQYASLQIVTGLSIYPLSIFGNYPLTPTGNGFYNAFLKCAWIEYGYITKGGDVRFENIENHLREALIRTVGITGPAINLSRMQAKKIVDQCRHITGITIGIKIVGIQNCIHQQILYLNEV